MKIKFSLIWKDLIFKYQLFIYLIIYSYSYSYIKKKDTNTEILM